MRELGALTAKSAKRSAERRKRDSRATVKSRQILAAPQFAMHWTILLYLMSTARSALLRTMLGGIEKTIFTRLQAASAAALPCIPVL